MPWILKEKTNNALHYVNTLTNETSTWSKIWTHSELGDFYCIDNIMMLPYQRKFGFDLAQQMEKIGIEKDEMVNSMQEIMDLCKEKKQGFDLEVFSKAQIIHSTLKNGWDYQKTALMTCSLLIIQEGDTIDIIDQTESVNKINLWSKDKPMMGFFLSIANQRCSSLINSLDPFTQMSSGNLSL
jgi:hypothetical protein